MKLFYSFYLFPFIFFLFPFILFLLSFSFNSPLLAQTDSNKVKSIVVSETPVEAEPFSYPGGKDSLQAFIKRTMKYPAKARANRLKGIVKISYTLNTDGTTIYPKVLQGIGSGCNEEAIRIVRLLKFNPGYAPEVRSIDIPFKF